MWFLFGECIISRTAELSQTPKWISDVPSFCEYTKVCWGKYVFRISIYHERPCALTMLCTPRHGPRRSTYTTKYIFLFLRPAYVCLQILTLWTLSQTTRFLMTTLQAKSQPYARIIIELQTTLLTTMRTPQFPKYYMQISTTLNSATNYLHSFAYGEPDGLPARRPLPPRGSGVQGPLQKPFLCVLFRNEIGYFQHCGAVEVSVRDLVPWKWLRVPGGYVMKPCS